MILKKTKIREVIIKGIGKFKQGKIISNIRCLLKFDPIISLCFIPTSRLSEKVCYIEELPVIEHKLHD